MADETFAEKLRYWREHGLNVAPSALPSRTPGAAPATPDPAWERGIVTETRPDGSVMPMLNDHLEPIPIKAYGENRRHYEGIRKRQLSGPKE